MCIEFVEAVKRNMPALLLKQKTHLILHLVSSMMQFGPSSSFSAERYMISMCEFEINFTLRFESFNSHVRNNNVHGNRLAPSRDIATKFCALQHLRYLCHGESERYSTDNVNMFKNIRS